jgi:ribonuclease HII
MDGGAGKVLLAGIDEAGLGPVLGPLVVSAAAFWAPAEVVGTSMWSLLSGAVCRRPGRKRTRIAIGDSKKLYAAKGKDGLSHLERGVLAMLGAAGHRPTTLGELLDCVSPAAGGHMAGYPWYGPPGLTLPQAIGPDDLRLSTHALSAAMGRRGIEPATLRAETVFEGEFNRIIASTDNKSVMLFGVTSRLLMMLWDLAGGDLEVHVDRQGGRVRYLRALQQAFEGARFKVIDENDLVSEYRMEHRGRRARLVFAVGAEDRQLPVALASMASKYLRELYMKLLNRYWVAQVADLAPTAGYYTDGRRFYRQIQPAVERLGFDHRQIYRTR